MNALVKFINGHEDGGDDPAFNRKWHLKATGVADGEFTACGLSYVDGYDTDEKSKDKGGVTCEQCLQVIRFYKTVKL